jgi:hypothetical protein
MTRVFAHNSDSIWLIEHLPPESETPKAIGFYAFLPLTTEGHAALKAHTLDTADPPLSARRRSAKHRRRFTSGPSSHAGSREGSIRLSRAPWGCVMRAPRSTRASQRRMGSGLVWAPALRRFPAKRTLAWAA